MSLVVVNISPVAEGVHGAEGGGESAGGANGIAHAVVGIGYDGVSYYLLLFYHT